MKRAHKYKFQPSSKMDIPANDRSPFVHVTLDNTPDTNEGGRYENPWSLEGPSSNMATIGSSVPRTSDMEEDRLSNIYTGLEPEQKPPGRFFSGGSAKFITRFNSEHRQSGRFSGHVNPAFDDDERSADNDSVNEMCRSASDDDSDVESALDEELDPHLQSLHRDSFEGDTPTPIEKTNGGRDFVVNFETIEPQMKPPLERRPTKRQREKPKWDRFTTTTQDNISNQDVNFWEKIFIFTKIVMSLILFMLTLGSAVAAKICFIIITANIFPANSTIINGPLVEDKNHSATWSRLKTMGHEIQYGMQTTHSQWIWALILMMGAPYLFSFFDSFWRVVFQMNHIHSPSCLTVVLVLLIEFLHSLGVNLMMFIVIPNFDPLSGLFLMWTVGIMPGIFKILYPRRKKKQENAPMLSQSTSDRAKSLAMKFVVGFFSLIGALGQLGALAAWAYHLYNVLHDDENVDKMTKVGYYACLIIAPILTSIHWWENFVKQGKKDSTGLPLLARNIRRCRTKLNMIASLWKLILSIVLPMIIFSIICNSGGKTCIDTLFFQSDNSSIRTGLLVEPFSSSKDNSLFSQCSNYLPLIIAALGILFSGLLFKLCKIATKILTQIFDMSIPLTLSFPVTIVIVIGMYSRGDVNSHICSGSDLPFPTWTPGNGINEFLDKLSDNSKPFVYWPVIAGAAAFFSFMVVTNHIWVPGKQRLQRTDQIFVRPLYCGIFPEQSIMLNRRRVEHAKHRDSKAKRAQIPLPDAKGQDLSDRSLYRTDETPMIYMCATMWHENENEMTQLLKSVFRMDEDQCTRKHAQFLLNQRDPDYYEFEAHIFFDDAFTSYKEDEYEYTVNKYVKELIRTVTFSASAVHGPGFKMTKPLKIATPYGGRLVWSLPGGNKLIAHLKDKQVIRHRKRWSQVMYMYYFLAYELFRSGSKKAKRLQKQADNTFLLALDGDVDFHPNSVLLLVDRMRKNPEVGAACGRIHPIGDGAMVWYQKFEYAVSHWLQKAAEDKLGCVLCSPGCFSMFRGSALMDDNVMNKYTTPPTEPRHYVQYDQGEDRWLCTLLLQQGHRVEYCAASDALTYAPEGFFEFFNQRRRWTPSTMANILDLLSDWKNVTKKNPDISLVYIFYQGLLMVSSILTPGTIFLMIMGAISMAYPVNLWYSLLLNTIPIGVMVLLCFCAKSETQLNYAAILSTGYSLVMMVVIVGLLVQVVKYAFCSVTTIFLTFVAGVFVTAALVHPQEFWCIIHGFLYFLAIPSMSMILMIYSLGNLHVVSWGTRENKTAAEVKEEKLKEGLSGVLQVVQMCCPGSRTRQEDRNLQKILNRLEMLEDNISNFSMARTNPSVGNSMAAPSDAPSVIMVGEDASAKRFSQLPDLEGGTTNNPAFIEEKQPVRDRLINPYWMEEEDLAGLKTDKIGEDETVFWNELIEEYLHPIAESPEEKERLQGELLELRNRVCLIFLLINSLFIIIVVFLQEVVSTESKLSISLCPSQGTTDPGQRIEPISMAFTLVFGLLLFLQFICMLMHRMATLLHICAATEIFKKKTKVVLNTGTEETEETPELSYDQAMSFVRDLQKNQDEDSISMVSDSSFADSEADDDEEAAEKRKENRRRWKKLATRRNKTTGTTLGANFQKNFQEVQKVLIEEEPQEEDNEDSYKEIEDLKRKRQFRRFTEKSLHTIAAIKRNNTLKQSIAGRKIIAKARFKDAVNKIQLGNLRKISDVKDGGQQRNTNTFAALAKALKHQDDLKRKISAHNLVEDEFEAVDGGDDVQAEAETSTTTAEDGKPASIESVSVDITFHGEQNNEKRTDEIEMKQMKTNNVVVENENIVYGNGATNFGLYENQTGLGQTDDMKEDNSNGDSSQVSGENHKRPQFVGGDSFNGDGGNEGAGAAEGEGDGHEDGNYDDTSTVRLSVPKVEENQWPEEDHYSVPFQRAPSLEDVRL